MAKKVKTQVDNISFLSGGGEMSALTRAKDWGQTSLGPIDRWPQSLRTTLSIILNSKFPMFLWWGPDLICFYNDGYRPSLGDNGKHPTALGMKGEEAFPEIWHIIKPLIDQVLAGGEATWSEDQLIPIFRNGKIEDVYWTFSYSPVNDESGKPAGVFVTCTETTKTVNTFNKLKESNRQFLNNIMQAPMAMCVFRGPEYIVEVANEPMLELWGKTADDVMLKPIFAGLPEAKGQGLEALLDMVYYKGERFSANERPVDLPRNGKIETTYINFVYEALRDADGTITGVVAIASEVTAQVVARRAIEESQQQLEFAIEAGEMGTFDYNPITNKFSANERLKSWFGLPHEAEIELSKALEVIADKDRQHVIDAIQGSLDFSRGGRFDVQYTIINPYTKVEIIVKAKGLATFDENKQAVRLNGTLQDVTKEEKAKAELAESRKHLELAIEIGALGTYNINFATGKTNFSQHIMDWFGFDDPDLPMSEVVPRIWPEDQPGVKEIMGSAMANEADGRHDLVYRVLHPADGQLRYLRSSGQVVFENGKPVLMSGLMENVTERLTAEKKIQDSKNQLEFAIEATELGTFDYDPHTNTFYANARYRDWLGMPAEGPIDLINALAVVSEEDRPKVEAALLRSFDPADGGHFDLQYTVTNARTGKARMVHAKGKTSFNEKGEAQRFNGTVQDVTEQTQNRKAIEESEERFRTMAEGTNVMIAVSDETGNATYFNTAWTRLTGRSMEDLLKFGWVDLIHPEDKERYVNIYLDAFQKKVSFTGEFRVLNQQGTYTWLLAQGPPRFRADGSFAGYISSCVDITERKKIESDLKKNQDKFRSLVESAPFALAVYVGEEMRIEIANQAIIDIWGKGNDVIGKLFSEVLPELATQKVFEQIREVYHTGIPFHIKNQHLDLVIDGKLRAHYFNYSFTPVFDADGKVFGVMNTGVDLTELNLAKQRIEESEQRFRHNVKQAPIGITIFRGPDFVVELANETYLLLVDRQEKDFVGRPLFDSLPEVRDIVEPLLTGVFTTGVPFYATDFPVTIHRFGQDELTYFNLSYQPLKEESGDITGIMVVATEVTASAKAKLQLEESEKRFRSLVISSSVPMAVLSGPDHVIEMANAVLLDKIWRRKEKDVLGKKLLDVFPELIGQKYPEQLRHVYTTGEKIKENESVTDVMGDDGMRRFYVDFEYAPLTDQNGNIYAILITSNDVTEKVEARRKVEEAGDRLRLATEATELSTWDLDLVTDEIFHSPRLAEIFGHEKWVHVDHPAMKAQLHPEDQEIVRRAFDTALETGVYKYEARVLKPDGDICWVQTRGKVVYDADGKPVKMIGTLRDATEEKYYQQQLEEREQKFRLLADSMPQQIWTGDPQGNLNYFNQSVYNYAGITQADIDRDGWIHIVHPDDRAENIRVWTEAVTTGNDFLFEHRFRRHDGEYRWQLSRAIPQRDVGGKIQMWVGTSTDIHEQKTFTTELEKQVRERTGELQEKNNELEKMNTELKSFAYVSSHDMQEPLRKIQTFADRLMTSEKQKLSEEGQFYLTRMTDAATRMRKLIDDLLSYSRLNNTEQALEKMNISLVVKEVTEELKEVIQEKQATITIDELCETRIIPFQFHQLFLNLISNSLKFASPERKPHIDIKSEIVSGTKLLNLKLSEDKNYCHIAYMDNGIGFEPEYSDKIFKVFQRLHPTGKYDGTGIGLAIVKKIVENHNGAITAEGETDKGATFNIYIPVV